mmetsp:Transcript_13970/g.39762  ORF Transcript_13970/g.39762 Transcript_13970/m.39762 type:complete len:279 (+) Transcript_13970:210-1046(+)
MCVRFLAQGVPVQATTNALIIQTNTKTSAPSRNIPSSRRTHHRRHEARYHCHPCLRRCRVHHPERATRLHRPQWRHGGPQGGRREVQPGAEVLRSVGARHHHHLGRKQRGHHRIPETIRDQARTRCHGGLRRVHRAIQRHPLAVANDLRGNAIPVRRRFSARAMGCPPGCCQVANHPLRRVLGAILRGQRNSLHARRNTRCLPQVHRPPRGHPTPCPIQPLRSVRPLQEPLGRSQGQRQNRRDQQRTPGYDWHHRFPFGAEGCRIRPALARHCPTIRW